MAGSLEFFYAAEPDDCDVDTELLELYETGLLTDWVAGASEIDEDFCQLDDSEEVLSGVSGPEDGRCSDSELEGDNWVS